MYKNFRLSLLCFLLIFLCSCSFFSGIRRSAALEVDIESSCVELAILSVPGVTGLEITSDKRNNSLYRFFSYSYQKLPAYIGLENGKDIRYWHSFGYINQSASGDDIKVIKPIMKLIDQRVSSMCGVHEFAKTIKEKCYKVKCKI